MINTLAIAGNLTKDSELRGNSGKVLAFSIAHNERVKDSSGQWVDQASFFNVVVFGTENYCSYLHKNLKMGKKVTVEGKLKQNRWESNGQNFYDVQIVARSVDFFHEQNRREGQGQQNSVASQQGQGYQEDDYYNRDKNSDYASVYQDNPVELDEY